MILSAAEKKKRTIQKRRKIAIIACAILIAVLAVALVFILDYVRTSTFVDRADGTEYYIRYRDGVYALYDTDKKTKLPTDEQYGYYVTHSGTMVGIDAETGEVTRTIYVDTSHLEGVEQLGVNDLLIMFPHVEKKDIRSVKVVNDNGKHSYEFARYNQSSFERDDNGEFAIVGSPMTAFDLDKFSSLHVAAGYAITSGKVQNPIKDESGAFSEYGLVPEHRVEIRVDENGDPYEYEYDYVPTYYILTEKSGKQHKVIIGDRLVTGTGYYAQYVKLDGVTETPFDAVYIFGTHVADSLLEPIESYVTPSLTYPMSMNTYQDVQYFTLNKKGANGSDYDQIVSFSYVDMSERENTSKHYQAYRFEEGPSPASSLKGYQPADESIAACLGALYDPSYVGIHTFMLNDEALVETRFLRPLYNEDGSPKLGEDGNQQYEECADYVLSFYYAPLDENNKRLTPVQNVIMISGPNEDGNYYATTEIWSKNAKGEYEFAYSTNMIVELDGLSMDFLTWDSYDWIASGYIKVDIVYCESIKIETPGYSATFHLDNSLSDQTEGKSSSLISITGSDSLGHATKTFAQKILKDKYGVTWVITTDSVKAYNSLGKELNYDSIHFENTSLGDQVQVDTVGIECENGDKVYVYADTIETHKASGGVERELRYQTSLFRDLYKTFSAASIKDSYPLTDWSDEKKAALLSDENCIMTLTFTTTEGEEYVYRFYGLTSRKAFMTLNGNGEFCVNPQRLEKFVSDCQRFFNLEPINESAKT